MNEQYLYTAEQEFTFGKNWKDFIEARFNRQRLDEAKKRFIDFCGKDSLKGVSFIDVGCGSGLFSLAAYELGAKQVISFDIDSDSVLCCRKLHKMAREPHNWKVKQGSVLDAGFLASLGKFEFVYSWGVLHHTGDMWRAIKNASALVKDGGFFYLAIYNKADKFKSWPDGRFGSSMFWGKIKRFYSHSPLPVRLLADWFSICNIFLFYVITLRNPFKMISEHKRSRGMSWINDIRDWLGGYPYEYAKSDEVVNFLTGDNDFKLINIKSNEGLLNNEYFFKKTNMKGEVNG